jgi:hypothetical protein
MPLHKETAMSFAIGTGSMTSVIAHWASEHASSMSDELRDLMKGADERAQFIKELNEIKSAITRGALNPAEFEKAIRLIESFIKEHPGSEFEGMLTTLAQDLWWEFQHYDQRGSGPDEGERNALQGYIGPNGKWGTALDGAIDDLRSQDRMGMLAIEDLVDKLKQAEMLGSNLIRALHDSAQSVIGNIS